jgi:deoxyribonuclease-4
MRLGFHMPVAGGLLGAVQASVALGLGCLQIFTGNPRGWSPKPLDPGLAADFSQAARQAGLDPVVAHAPYLINLASPDEALWAKSVASLADQLGRARALGAAAVVVHPGSRGGREPAWGLDRVAEGVAAALKRAGEGVACWLENTCGAGGQIGGSLEELAGLLARLEGLPVAVCLDTAHAWGSGYGLDKAAAVRAFLDRVEATAGLENVTLWHLNDTRHALGSRRDEHQHLGKGLLGRAGVAALLAEPRLAGATMVMETPTEPPEGRLADLKLARAILRQAGVAGTADRGRGAGEAKRREV